MANSKPKINYAKRLRDIRPYVDFNYNLNTPLNSAAKTQINRYYEYIQKLTVRDHQIYRTKNTSNLRSVQRFAQHDPRFVHLTVAFVPNSGDERMKITINKNGEVRGKTGHIGVFEIPMNRKRLIQEGRKYIEQVIKKGPRVKRYVIQAAEFEVPGAFAREFIVDEVVRMMERYGADQYDETKGSSHYFGNWMWGLNGYTFHNQSELGAYREKKRQAAKERSREYIREKRREKRIADNPPGFWVNDTLGAVKRARPPQPNGWREVKQREFYEAIFVKKYKETKK